MGSVFIVGFMLGQRACESSYSTRDEGRPFQYENQFAGVAECEPRRPRILKG